MPIRIPQGNIIKATGTDGPIALVTGTDGPIFQLAPPLAAPTVVNLSTVTLAATSFTPRGQVTALNGSDIISYGFEYGTTSSLGTSVSSSNIAANLVFSRLVTGLPSGTTIFWRAFATNTTGTGIAATTSSQTGVLPLQPGDIITGISVNANGAVTVTTNGSGFVYYIGDDTTGGTTFTADTNSATASIYGLTDRATSRIPNIGIQVSDAGVPNNGVQLSIRTIQSVSQPPALPFALLTEVSATTSSAQLVGTINTAFVGAAATSANFYYLIDDTDRDAAYIVANGTSTSASLLTGTTGASITLATSFSIRQIQAVLVASNGNGDGTSSVIRSSIPALSVSPLTVITLATTSITDESAYFTGQYTLGAGGSISSNGTGFIYGTNRAAVEEGISSRTGVPLGTGVTFVQGDKINPEFNATVSLTMDTTYFVSAVARDELGWHDDGSAETFTTAESLSAYTFDGSFDFSFNGEITITSIGTASFARFFCPITGAQSCSFTQVTLDETSVPATFQVNIEYGIPQGFIGGGTVGSASPTVVRGATPVDGTAAYNTGVFQGSSGGGSNSFEVNVSGYGPAANTIPVGTPFTQTETYNIRTIVQVRVDTTRFTCVETSPSSNGGADGACSNPTNAIGGFYDDTNNVAGSDTTGGQLSRTQPAVGTLQPSAVNGTAEYDTGSARPSTGGGVTTVEVNLSGYGPDPSTVAAGVEFTQTETYNIRTDTADRIDTTRFTCVEVTEEANGGAAGTCSSPPNNIGGFFDTPTTVTTPSTTGSQLSRDQQNFGTMVALTLTASINNPGGSTQIGSYSVTIGGSQSSVGTPVISWSAGGQAGGSSSGINFSPTDSGNRGTWSVSVSVSQGGLTASDSVGGFTSGG